MRYTVFVDQKQITYNTYDILCDPKVREEAKQTMLAVDTKTWPRTCTQATPNTSQGNQDLLDLIFVKFAKSSLADRHYPAELGNELS
jgi:hypothetical protein